MRSKSKICVYYNILNLSILPDTISILTGEKNICLTNIERFQIQFNRPLCHS